MKIFNSGNWSVKWESVTCIYKTEEKESYLIFVEIGKDDKFFYRFAKKEDRNLQYDQLVTEWKQALGDTESETGS